MASLSNDRKDVSFAPTLCAFFRGGNIQEKRVFPRINTTYNQGPFFCAQDFFPIWIMIFFCLSPLFSFPRLCVCVCAVAAAAVFVVVGAACTVPIPQKWPNPTGPKKWKKKLGANNIRREKKALSFHLPIRVLSEYFFPVGTSSHDSSFRDRRLAGEGGDPVFLDTTSPPPSQQ